VSSTLDIVRNDVRTLRQAAGMSQAALAEALGVSRQTVIAIEVGRYDPSLPLAIAIAHHFRTTVEEIFHVDPD
jgi:putative transcriptional regulator